MKRSFKVRLRCRDEAKGPVTAVCGIDGYLVSSMGQKVVKYPRTTQTLLMLLLFQIFVRAFDLDERLVGVAFLDVGVYVTTMRSLKNLLIIGDAVKSVWFVAFQVCLLRLQAAKKILAEMAGHIGRSIQTRRSGEGSSQGLRNCRRLFLCGRTTVHRYLRRRRRRSAVRV
jgi:hypothetical protein